MKRWDVSMKSKNMWANMKEMEGHKTIDREKDVGV